MTAPSGPSWPSLGAAVVTRAWGAQSEEGLAVRQVAAALAHAGPVRVARLGTEESPARPDGAFVVHGLESAPPDHRRRALLLDLFGGPGRRGHPLPAPGQAWLRELDGVPAEGLGDWLDEACPGLVVAAGLDEASADVAVSWAERHGAPAVGIPLATPDLLATAAYDERLRRFSAVLAPSFAEAAAVAAGRGERPTDVFSGLVLSVNPLAWHSSPHGLEETGFVLYLCGLPSDEPGSDDAAWALAERCHVTLAERVPGLVSVLSGTDRLVVAKREGTEALRPAAGRMDLWRLLVRSSVVVDLRPEGYLGREVLEAMLAGVAVVVPERAPVSRTVEAADAGLWWSTPAELEAAVAELAPRPGGRAATLASTLGEQGRAFAKHWLGSPDDFVARVLRSVGTEP